MDRFSYRTISGWAFDSARHNDALEVEIFLNGEKAGSTPANIYRADLAAAQIGDGRHGFAFSIPENTVAIDTVDVRCCGSENFLPHAHTDWFEQDTNRSLPSEWRDGHGSYRFPSVFLLGAAKSGTTSLYEYLRQCTGVCLSDPKEPYFFEDEYDRGPSFYFNRYFSQWSDQEVVAEARHRNLYLPWVPERIYNYNPNARLVAILREPVERAVSHWWHWYSRTNRSVECLSFRKAIQADLARIEKDKRLSPAELMERYASVLMSDRNGVHRLYQKEGLMRTYVDSGFYMDQIDRYVRLFGRDQIHVLLLDDLIASPQTTFASLLTFLELDPAMAQDIDYSVCNAATELKPSQNDADTLELLADLYRPHNKRLANFLGRSLAMWERRHPAVCRAAN